ncbi:MAG: hypothetical protein V7L05_10445 [Nostoc sp.]|uniref:hypothetical protein n=1 Tax=Nostoc sp. TaxID=1180 RepID=UPI002FF7F69C
MVYNQFTITKVKRTFGILTQENIQFFADIPPAEPAKYIQEFLKESIPLAVAIRNAQTFSWVDCCQLDR